MKRFTPEQWEKTKSRIQNADEKADYSEVLDSWHNLLSQASQGAFASESEPGKAGAKWATPIWRSLFAWGKPILQFTGRLMKSLLRKGAEGVDVIDQKSSVFGTEVPYAGYHQYGAYDVPVTANLVNKNLDDYPNQVIDIPQRVILNVDDDMADALAESVADHLIEQILMEL